MAGLSYGARPLLTFKPELLACRGGAHPNARPGFEGLIPGLHTIGT